MASRSSLSVVNHIQRLFGAGTVAALSENQLLERFVVHGDEAAFEAILHRHGAMVLGVCRRLLSDVHDVEDAFQATFLVLVKKAATIRDRDVLGTWLYRVAHRVAVRARIEARRRRGRDWSCMEEPAANDTPVEREALADLKAVMEEEVARLTERYRSPFVLCALEGQTCEQAAAELGCPVGTVKSRLSRAREKLQSRLVRRGLTPSVGLVAMCLSPEPAAAMPARLVNSTIRAATQMAAGRAITAGTVSAAVAALLEGTLKTMSISSLKYATAALSAAIVVATGAGLFADQTPGNSPAETVDQATPNNPVSNVVREPTPSPPADRQADLASLAQARYQAAQRSLKAARDQYRAGEIAIDALRSKAARVLEAQRDLNKTKTNGLAALDAYLRVMKESERAAQTKADKEDAKYYRLEAELWLAEARAGNDPARSGAVATNPAGAPEQPGTDPRSVELIAKLEKRVPMSFPNPTPLEDVIKYIKSATAGPDDSGIEIYVEPPRELLGDVTPKTPITIDLQGAPLRRTLKLIADQLGMGYGIKDGVVHLIYPDYRNQNWRELRVIESSFPQISPLQLEVEKAERGELTDSELRDLTKRLEAIEQASKLYKSIKMSRFGPMALPKAEKQAR
jgi:RNA polymerase sigma factor (sigma-70 family)